MPNIIIINYLFAVDRWNAFQSKVNESGKRVSRS